MKLWDWLGDAVAFMGWQVILVGGVIVLFDGTKRLAQGAKTRTAILKVAAAGAVFLTLGSFSIWLSQSMARVVPMLEIVKPVSLAEDWGADLSPEDREKKSRALASLVFTSSGNVSTYVQTNGKWVDYCPTSEDASLLMKTTDTKARLELLSNNWMQDAFAWWGIGIVTALLGYLSGRNSKTGAPGGGAARDPTPPNTADPGGIA